MRLVQVMVPTGKREAIVGVARETIGPPAPAVEIRYVAVETAGDTSLAAVSPPSPSGAPTPRRPGTSAASPAAPA